VGLNVKVLKITGAKDPDEFLQKYGPPAFQRLLDNSENQAEYQLLQIQKKYDLTDDEQRVRFLQEAAGLIAGMDSPVEREVYGSRAARAAQVESKVMGDEVERQRRQRGRRARRQEERRAMTPAANLQPEERKFRYQNVRSALAEEGVLRLVLMEPELFQRLEGLSSEQFSAPVLGRIYDLLCRRWEEGLESTVDTLSAQLTTEEVSHLTRILQTPERPASAEQALADYRRTIETEYRKRSMAGDADLLNLIRSASDKKARRE
jgi:DNA primase